MGFDQCCLTGPSLTRFLSKEKCGLRHQLPTGVGEGPSPTRTQPNQVPPKGEARIAPSTANWRRRGLCLLGSQSNEVPSEREVRIVPSTANWRKVSIVLKDVFLSSIWSILKGPSSRYTLPRGVLVGPFSGDVGGSNGQKDQASHGV